MPETQEQTEVNEPTPTPSPKKSLIPPNSTQLLTKIAMFGLVSLVAILAAYLLTVKVLRPMMARSVTPQEQVAEEQAKAAEASADTDTGDEHGSAGSAEFYTIESIIVNPAGTAGTRYLSCSVSFELPSKDDLKAFEEKSVKIKDILITIFSSKTVGELADVKKRNSLRRQILEVVNKYAAPAHAEAVYLTDFVLQ